MTRRRAIVLVALSLTALLAIAVAWSSSSGAPERADLVVGPPKSGTTASSAAPTSTASTASTVPAPTEPPTSPVAPRGGPVEPLGLRIPDLGVDATVTRVGLSPDGQMEVPAPTQVGWYGLGPRPGDTGSAVLAAHIDYAGQRGVFFSLPALQVGAEVWVRGTDGTEQRFRVVERAQIPKAEIRLEDYFTNEGPARLSLITCGGAFNSGTRHYDDNIVITATPA